MILFVIRKFSGLKCISEFIIKSTCWIKNRLEGISTVRTRYWCCFFVCDTCNIINYLRKYYIRHNLTFFYLIIKLLPRSQLFLVKSELLVDKGSYFFRGRTCSQWGYLQNSYFSKQLLLHSIKIFTAVTFSEKDIFEKSNIQQHLLFERHRLCEKCPYSELFFSVFFCIWT